MAWQSNSAQHILKVQAGVASNACAARMSYLLHHTFARTCRQGCCTISEELKYVSKSTFVQRVPRTNSPLGCSACTSCAAASASPRAAAASSFSSASRAAASLRTSSSFCDAKSQFTALPGAGHAWHASSIGRMHMMMKVIVICDRSQTWRMCSACCSALRFPSSALLSCTCMGVLPKACLAAASFSASLLLRACSSATWTPSSTMPHALCSSRHMKALPYVIPNPVS